GSGDGGSFTSLLTSLTAIAADIDAGLGEVTAAQREEVVTTLADATGRLEAFLCDAVGMIDGRGDFLAAGAKSVRVFVAARSELSPGHVGSVASTARELHELPAVAAARRAGHLGSAKMRMLLRTDDAVRPFLVRDQHDLVAALEPLTVAGAGRYVKRWEESAMAELAASPDDPEPEPEPPVNSVRMSAGVGSEQMLHGIFDALTG